MLESGSFGRNVLQRHFEKMKTKKNRSEFQRPRGNSLVDTVHFGACAFQGSRVNMEDIYQANLWESITQKSHHEKVKRNGGDAYTSDIEEGPIPSPEFFAPRFNGEKVSSFAVMDGHGGIQAADYVNSHLFQNITKQPKFMEDTEAAILKGFSDTEEGFAQLASSKDLDGMIGTTVTSVMIVGNTLYVANVGDSEAVLCTKGKEKILTQSHTPNNEKERKRVEEVGGVIVRDRIGNCRLGHPLWNPNFINIGVTRAIGDFYFKDEKYLNSKVSGMTAIPSICSWTLTMEDEFLIVASDGFWDVVSPKEAVEIVLGKINQDSNSICKELTELGEKRKSRDNITVVLIKFNGCNKELKI